MEVTQQRLQDYQKFVTEANNAFNEFKVSPNDLGEGVWESFFEGIYRGTLDSEQALIRLRAILEQLSSSTPPEPEEFTGDSGNTDDQAEAEKRQAEAAREAAEAEEKRRKATEAANNVPPPNNPPTPPNPPSGGNNNPPNPPGGSSGGGRNNPPGGGSGGGGNNPPPSPSPNIKPNSKIIRTTYRDDRSWEKQYLVSDGRILAAGERWSKDDDGND